MQEWDEYNRYCQCMQSGDRKGALRALRPFLAALECDAAQKAAFAESLCLCCGAAASPRTTLLNALLENLLWEYLRPQVDYKCPQHRLKTFCLYARPIGGPEGDKLSYFLKALAQDAHDEALIEGCYRLVADRVGYAVHELPCGYLGDPLGDLDDLAALDAVVSGSAKAAAYRTAIAALQNQIRASLAAP